MTETELIIEDKIFVRFIGHRKILTAVRKIAGSIHKDFPSDENLYFIGILNGSFMFAADLIRFIKRPVFISFVRLSSYIAGNSSGNVLEILGLTENIEGKNVIIIEDIVDSGLTIKTVINMLKQQHPKTLKTAAIFVKTTAMKEDVTIDYKGIEIPDRFIVGYGLDYNGYGRNYKDVYILK